MLLPESDLSALCPSLGVPPATPLATMALWELDRLKKSSRVKADLCTPKDIVRCFAKVLLALRELAETSACQSPSRVPTEVEPSVPIQLPMQDTKIFQQPLPLVPAARVIHSAVGKRSSPKAPQNSVCHDEFFDCISTPATWMLAMSSLSCKASAVPPFLTRSWASMLSTWRSAAAFAFYVLILVLTWLPVAILSVGFITVISDPFLALSILWDLLQWPTRSLRSHMTSTAMASGMFSSPRISPSPTVVYLPQMPAAQSAMTGPLPSGGPAMPELSSFTQPSPAQLWAPGQPDESWAHVALRYGFAGQVGACFYWLAARAR